MPIKEDNELMMKSLIISLKEMITEYYNTPTIRNKLIHDMIEHYLKIYKDQKRISVNQYCLALDILEDEYKNIL